MIFKLSRLATALELAMAGLVRAMTLTKGSVNA
jgi:hypothetical protein